MRRVFYMFVATVSLALFSGQAYAQRYLPGMMGVELRGGFAGGSKGPLNYYTGFAVSGYTKKATAGVAGAGIPAEELWVSYHIRTPCPVHGRGRLLPEVPVRPFKDTVPFHRRFSLVGYETVNWVTDDARRFKASCR